MSNKNNEDVVLRVENMGKRYFIDGRKSEESSNTGSWVQRIAQRMPLVRQKEAKEEFWALRDVSFELKRGDVLGVIGRNGSGKSTMLKILAGVTMPTEGRAELHGLVGSLLEVGTGFHPDLTGRENIYMNGALLGIKQEEIRRRFDEIVDYSGIGTFIDVPVKRYSSGMYVRLAYSVTSLLRSDILLLDEVLAVGDAEFQKKTKRSVESISHDGRTVIFVSHSMASIQKICTHALWLDHGRVIKSGPVDEITSDYIEETTRDEGAPKIDISEQPAFVPLDKAQGISESRDVVVLTSIETMRGDGTPTRLFNTGETMKIRIGYRVKEPSSGVYFCVFVQTLEDARVMVLYSNHGEHSFHLRDEGVIECVIPALQLVSGDYSIMLDYGLIDMELRSVDCVPDATRIRIDLGDYLGSLGLTRNQGSIAQQTSWEDLVKGG